MYTLRLTSEQLHAVRVALETEYAALMRRPVIAGAVANEYEIGLSQAREAIASQWQEQYEAGK